MEKKKNIWTYFVKMFIIFMIIFWASQFGMMILHNSFTYLKYGPDIIMQSIWAVLVLIVVLSFKNAYIFKEEREKTTTSLKLGWPLLLISLMFLILNIVLGIIEGANFDIPTILNLATFCLLIGIVEEFLCRGWLLNEFLERFSDSKKNIIFSIILSSIIFGFIHIFNIMTGQSLADTLVQVLSATIFGMCLGLIYYKTKNIWSVVLIHAIWDFCLMLGDSTRVVDCFYGETTNSIILFNFIFSIVVVIADGLICYWLYKQTELSIDTKKLTKVTYCLLPIISLILYTGSSFIEPEGYDEYYICPTYETKDIGQDYETQYYSHLEYSLTYTKEINTNNTIVSENSDNNTANISKNNDNFNFVLSLNNETYEVEFENKETGKKIVLTEGLAYDYLLLENEDSYVILIQNDYNKVLYGLFKKEDISNDNTYLETVKANLKEYTVPEINLIGSVTIGKSDYKYAQIQTSIYDKLYFDETGTLYIVTSE